MRLRNTGRTTVALCGTLALLAASALLQRSAAVPTQTSKAVSSDFSTGKSIYDQKCEPCHYSASAEKKIGPGLGGLMKRVKFKNGLAANDQNLRRVIERGGKDMPGFRNSLKEKQLRDLISYMKTL
jgi:cytochrome c2